jgi:hypothetical protein
MNRVVILLGVILNTFVNVYAQSEMYIADSLSNYLTIKDSINSKGVSIKLASSFYCDKNIYVDKDNKPKFKDSSNFSSIDVFKYIDIISLEQSLNIVDSNTKQSIKLIPSLLYGKVGKKIGIDYQNVISFFVTTTLLTTKDTYLIKIKNWAYLGLEIESLHTLNGTMIWYKFEDKAGKIYTNGRLKDVLTKYGVDQKHLNKLSIEHLWY